MTDESKPGRDETDLDLEETPSVVVSLKIGETICKKNIVVIATLENEKQQVLFLNHKQAYVLSVMLESRLVERRVLTEGVKH